MPRCSRARPGFLLLEVMLGIAVFGLFLGAAALVLLHGQQNTASGGDRVRGAQAAINFLEAGRSIRDGSFSSLTAGTHGVAVGPAPGRTWVLSGSKLIFTGGYITSLTVAPLDTDWLRVTASTKWRQGIGRSGSVVLTTELTDWRGTRRTGDWSSLSVEGSYVDGGSPQFNGIAIAGDYAYVTSDTSTGGAGLYVFDIGSLSAPARVAASFSLGTAGYGVVARGTTLYVLTGDTSAELQAYDISSPATLSAANRLASYDLGGSGLAETMAIRGNILFVGANLNASYPEILAFSVGTGSSLTLLSSLDYGASADGVSFTGTGLFLATSNVAGEMVETRFTSTGALSFAADPEYNTTGGVGRSVAVSGTSGVLGLHRSPSSQELVLIDTSFGGDPQPSDPGPWYYEGSGSILSIALDATACQAFLAADSSGRAVQVVQLTDYSLPRLSSYDSTTGPARALYYDPVRDRLFAVTRSALLIFQPGASPGACP